MKLILLVLLPCVALSAPITLSVYNEDLTPAKLAVTDFWVDFKVSGYNVGTSTKIFDDTDHSANSVAVAAETSSETTIATEFNRISYYQHEDYEGHGGLQFADGEYYRYEWSDGIDLNANWTFECIFRITGNGAADPTSFIRAWGDDDGDRWDGNHFMQFLRIDADDCNLACQMNGISGQTLAHTFETGAKTNWVIEKDVDYYFALTYKETGNLFDAFLYEPVGGVLADQFTFSGFTGFATPADEFYSFDVGHNILTSTRIVDYLGFHAQRFRQEQEVTPRAEGSVGFWDEHDNFHQTLTAAVQNLTSGSTIEVLSDSVMLSYIVATQDFQLNGNGTTAMIHNPTSSGSLYCLKDVDINDFTLFLRDIDEYHNTATYRGLWLPLAAGTEATLTNCRILSSWGDLGADLNCDWLLKLGGHDYTLTDCIIAGEGNGWDAALSITLSSGASTSITLNHCLIVTAGISYAMRFSGMPLSTFALDVSESWVQIAYTSGSGYLIRDNSVAEFPDADDIFRNNFYDMEGGFGGVNFWHDGSGHTVEHWLANVDDENSVFDEESNWLASDYEIYPVELPWFINLTLTTGGVSGDYIGPWPWYGNATRWEGSFEGSEWEGGTEGHWE